MEVYTSITDDQIETSFSKMECIVLARIRSGHHPALRRWMCLVGVSEDTLCRLCGEEVISAEHI